HHGLHDEGPYLGREGGPPQGLAQAAGADPGDRHPARFVTDGRTTSTGHGAWLTIALETLPSNRRFAADRPRDPMTKRSVGWSSRWPRISSMTTPSVQIPVTEETPAASARLTAASTIA